jgi:hypothetical protein
MDDSARPMSRYRVCSVLTGVVVAAVALSPAAYADDDSGDPDQPSIVVGGTVHPPTVIVVDPLAPAVATGTGPINPAKPIAVDPRVRPASPKCCDAIIENGKETPQLRWPWDDVKGVPPVFPVQERPEANRTTYLDNHGRYWLLYFKPRKMEQVGGWPGPQTTSPSGQPGTTNNSGSGFAPAGGYQP